MRAGWFALCLAWGMLQAQEFSRLPNWAAVEARASLGELQPADAGAWVILDRTEVAYTGNGEIREHRFRLVKVLGEKGLLQARYTLFGLGGQASEIKKLKGWNLRPDGSVTTLEANEILTMPQEMGSQVSPFTRTSAVLDRVVKGSYVAFESLESRTSPCGPLGEFHPMEDIPVRRWELDMAKREGWFISLKSVEMKMVRRHFDPWLSKVDTVGTTGLRISGIPAWPKDEEAHPHWKNALPAVRVKFYDPETRAGMRWASWDGAAAWFSQFFVPPAEPLTEPGLPEAGGLAGLRAIWAWMGTTLTYRKVYLTPERGWVPERPAETLRKRYGDCKDFTALFIAEAQRLGFPGFPGYTGIVEGEIEPDEESYPTGNHAITALRLPASLGLPAEVETPRGRFLLADPTDPLTPLGYLSSLHEGHRVLICLPDGGAWVTVPPAAILRGRLVEDITGKWTGPSLQASLRLKETGEYWGLRGAARAGGSAAVRNRLISQCLALHPDAQVTISRLGDPLDLDHPFEVDVEVCQPLSLGERGGVVELAVPGFPEVPHLIQKFATGRRYPVWKDAAGRLEIRAQLEVPSRVIPVAPERTVETAFRRLLWKAESRPAQDGTALTLTLEEDLIPARFGFEEKEQGVTAWNRDRLAVKTLLEDGFSFKRSLP